MAVKQAEQGQQRRPGQSGQADRGQRDSQQSGAPGPANQTNQERGLSAPMAPFPNPFTLLQRFLTGDLSDLFADAGRGRRPTRASAGDGSAANIVAWVPKVDVVQRGNELVIRADLPGMNPDDVVVEIGDDAITISGEREQQHEEDRGNVYRFERSYGAFYRVVPLPEGAMGDQAKASFKDGVLEITVPAPPEHVSRGRRLEIARGDTSAGGSQDQETRRS
jgi:HSP20 family protein